MTTKICTGLYVWTLTLDTGEFRQILASSLQSAIGHLPVISAQRGPAVNGAPAPPPVLTLLTPATAILGSPNFTLHVTGTGFKATDVILWNGGEEPTTFVSATELTTLVNMATAAVAITLPVAVRNALGVVSNSLDFTLTTVEAAAA